MMRALACGVLLLIAATANAGTLQDCELQEKDADAVQACVEAERIKSTNQLRKAGLAAEAAAQQKFKDGGKNLMRGLRAMQARHVRERGVTCRKQVTIVEQKACIADMNYAHIAQLARFAAD